MKVGALIDKTGRTPKADKRTEQEQLPKYVTKAKNNNRIAHMRYSRE